jgi:hypothetical protein
LELHSPLHSRYARPHLEVGLRTSTWIEFLLLEPGYFVMERGMLAAGYG